MANLSNNSGGGNLGGVPGASGAECFYCPLQPNLALQQLSFYFTWDIPFLRKNNNWISKIAGGWQFSGIVTVNSGSPLDANIGQDWNYSGGDNGAERLNLNGAVQYPKQELGNGIIQWFDVGNTNPQSGRRGPFVLPANSDIGNLSPDQLMGPGSSDVDAALMKNCTSPNVRPLYFPM
jgi:hypothetical protein